MFKSTKHTIVFISILLSSFSCSKIQPDLKTAESIFISNPDSAQAILDKINVKNLNSASRAKHALLQLKVYSQFTTFPQNDSLIRIATSYFDQNSPADAGFSWLYKSIFERNYGYKEEQAESLLKAEEFAKKSDDHRLKANIYCEKADIYDEQKNNDMTLKLRQEGLQEYVLAKDTYNISLTALMIGLYYLNISPSPKDSTQKYLSQALELAKTIKDTILISTTYKVIGNTYFITKDYHTALKYYLLSPTTNIETYDYNKWTNIAWCYYELGHLDSAKLYCSKIKFPHKTQNYLFYQIDQFYYDILKHISKDEGNIGKAFYYAEKEAEIKDSISKINLRNSFAGLEKKYNYDKLRIKNTKLELQYKQRGIIILFVILTLSLLIIMFIFKNYQNNKDQLHIQQQLNDQKRKLLEKVIENNELLQRQNRIQQILLQNVENFKTQTFKASLISGKRNTPEDIKSIKDEIIIYADTSYNNISRRLSEQFPRLTERDIFICCMLLNEFDTGMIATILEVKTESINIHRSRLRKKLSIKNEINLIDYLKTF